MNITRQHNTFDWKKHISAHLDLFSGRPKHSPKHSHIHSFIHCLDSRTFNLSRLCHSLNFILPNKTLFSTTILTWNFLDPIEIIWRLSSDASVVQFININLTWTSTFCTPTDSPPTIVPQLDLQIACWITFGSLLPSSFDRLFYFWRRILFLTERSTSDGVFCFWRNALFLTEHSTSDGTLTSDKLLYFWQTTLLLTDYSTFNRVI